MEIIEKRVKKLITIGNGRGVVLPKMYIDVLGLDEGIELTIFEDKIEIRKASKKLKNIVNR